MQLQANGDADSVWCHDCDQRDHCSTKRLVSVSDGDIDHGWATALELHPIADWPTHDGFWWRQRRFDWSRRSSRCEVHLVEFMVANGEERVREVNGKFCASRDSARANYLPANFRQKDA
jgi:hypothetical protein